MKKRQMSRPKVETKKINSIDTIKISNILPALQSDIWKKMGIDSKKCSRLMKTLEENGIIKRTRVKGGSYMVEMVNININTDKSVIQARFIGLLSDSGKFSPCVECKKECDPGRCRSIDNWVMDTDK